jgi:hypothetical protein
MSQAYKGRIIDPRAYEVSDGTGWVAKVTVAEDVDDETVDTLFQLKGVFATKDKALEAALAFGKKEVDNRVRSSEVNSIFEEANKMPATSQEGFSPSSDFGIRSDGERAAVRRIKTPDDPSRC